jgi:cell wall-associated NlpC family hydrolase
MILGTGIGLKLALAGVGVAGGVVLIIGAANGGAQESSLAVRPETITALCGYTAISGQKKSSTPPSALSARSAPSTGTGPVDLRALAALGLDAKQQDIAQVVVQTAASDGLPKRAATIGIATSLQESDLGRHLVGDHGTSFGIFHQKPTSGYGTRQQILDPHHASHAFFSRLRKLARWESLPLTLAAQAVQHSAYPDAYARHERRAEQIVDAIGFSGLSGRPSASATQPSADDLPLTADEKATIKSQVVVAAATGLSRVDATAQITQSVTVARSAGTPSSGQAPSVSGQTDPRLRARVTEHVQKAATELCTELTTSVSRLPGNLAGSAHGMIAVHAAMKMIGTPYSWGGGGTDGPGYGIEQGAGTKGFDCSGLAQYAWAKAGTQLGRTTGDQWSAGLKIPRDQLQPGDLLFFATNPRDPATIHHVGINIDGQHMIQAPHTGASVEISRWSGIPYREHEFIGAVRPTN